MGRPGPGAGGEPRDPALADFPERAPGTRRWTSADPLGPHFLDAPGQPVLLIRRPLEGLDRLEDLPLVVGRDAARGTSAP
ncbi:hypothetical protein ACI796_18310 [Geodermatophilus sp. SYSU D00525]